MKKQVKLLCLVALLLAVIACITACGKRDEPYKDLDGQGYTVSIRFDVNGGMFAGINDVSVVDVYHPDDIHTADNGEKQIYLLDPSDKRRGEQSALTASKNDYFLAGWYQERTPRVNEQGEALDDYGQLCSESGKAQGYVYGKPWDFSKPLVIDGEEELNVNENYLTLYAAWVPYFNFEIYAVDPATGEMMYTKDETSGKLVTVSATTQALFLEMPEWDQNTGKINMKKFPTPEALTKAEDGSKKDVTFGAAYLDAAMTQPATGTLAGTWDPVTATLTTDTVKLYTTWMEGEWFHIYTAKQFFDNSKLDGNYILCADLDFSETVWKPILATNEKGFTGKILGNGHTMANISVEQANTSQLQGGIFANIGAAAEIRDVKFENVTYTIGAGSRMQGASFGLLAGTVADGAVLEQVTLSGSLVIGAKCFPGDYTVGLVCGTGSVGVDHANITASAEEGANITVDTDAESGVVTVTFGS